MAKNEWVAAAMADDAVVVELLVRLKQRPPMRLPPLEWGVRQPRSRPVFRCGTTAVASRKEKPDRTARGSPTTPLSWSGGVGVGGGGGGGGADSPTVTGDGGFEDTSPPVGRSKGVSGGSEATIGTTSRRMKKKKTFAELKAEESLLLKETTNLRKEVESMRVTVEEQRAANQRLKKMKVDLDLQPTKQPSASCSAEMERAQTLSQKTRDSHLDSSCSAWPTQASLENFPLPDSTSSKEVQKIADARDKFVLPDLNVMPTEDDSGPLWGCS